MLHSYVMIATYTCLVNIKFFFIFSFYWNELGSDNPFRTRPLPPLFISRPNMKATNIFLQSCIRIYFRGIKRKDWEILPNVKLIFAIWFFFVDPISSGNSEPVSRKLSPLGILVFWPFFFFRTRFSTVLFPPENYSFLIALNFPSLCHHSPPLNPAQNSHPYTITFLFVFFFFFIHHHDNAGFRDPLLILSSDWGLLLFL